MTLIYKLTILLMLIVWLFNDSNCYGQIKFFDNDKELASLYSKIFPFYYGNSDSLNYYSQLFSKKFTTFINSNPSTLGYKFQVLEDSNACRIITSPDHLFRIYSWNTWLGGTMRNYNNLFQFKCGNKIYLTDLNKNEDDVGSYFINIFTLKANNNIYYLVTSMSSESSKDVYETISIYTISGDTLDDKVKLIKTQNGMSNSISFEYDFLSVANRSERPIHLIKYDENKRTIFIPVVLENGKVTDRYILYHFNGQYFEKVQS